MRMKNHIIIYVSPTFGNVSNKPIKWRITQETKKIGDYQCYKAISSEKLYSRQDHYYNKKIVAWFTPEIQVSFGPSRYSGLTGKILQIERDKITLTTTKININPNEKYIKIKRIEINE